MIIHVSSLSFLVLFFSSLPRGWDGGGAAPAVDAAAVVVPQLVVGDVVCVQLKGLFWVSAWFADFI